MATGYKNSLTYLTTSVVYYWAAATIDLDITGSDFQDFDHLRMIMQTSNQQSTNNMGTTFKVEYNGDTTASNYFKTMYYTTKGDATYTHYTGQDNDFAFSGPRYNVSSGTYQSAGSDTVLIGDFYNVHSSSLKKQFKARLIQADRYATYYAGFVQGIWDNTNAITNIAWQFPQYAMSGSAITWFGYNSA